MYMIWGAGQPIILFDLCAVASRIQSMRQIQVLLVDDHALVRAGFRGLLQSLPGVEVVAEAKDGREALSKAHNYRPDVVFMDIAMPALNGLEATARLKRELPDIQVVIISMHADEKSVLQALRAGASGYLLKNADVVELEIALRAVIHGETYLSPPVSKHVITGYVQRVKGESNLLDHLTPRQREVLQLIAEGHTTQQIAHVLDISVKTVETHRRNLMDRLEIYDIAGLVRYAIRVGLVAPE